VLGSPCDPANHGAGAWGRSSRGRGGVLNSRKTEAGEQPAPLQRRRRRKPVEELPPLDPDSLPPPTPRPTARVGSGDLAATAAARRTTYAALPACPVSPAIARLQPAMEPLAGDPRRSWDFGGGQARRRRHRPRAPSLPAVEKPGARGRGYGTTAASTGWVG
jgi:hypothetical protein